MIKIIIILFIAVVYIGCKKDKPTDLSDEEIVSPTTGTRNEFTLDSIFLYAKQIYLWNDVLPGYSSFAPRAKYSNVEPGFIAFKNELFDISQIKLNQATGKPFEMPYYNNTPKYSFLQVGRTSRGIHAGIADGEAILAKSTIHLNDKVIAYLALGSFPALSIAKSELNKIFDQMAVEKPKYLILDLRYNGGGYVETAEYVANLIAPSTLNGKIMYSEQFNPTLQNGKATILRHQPYLDENGKTITYNGRLATLADVDYSENGNTYKFDKKGTLESIQDVYIIISGQTASASELLISCLKPYFNVKLIGERTYGKPIGFFGINIDQYALYLSSFLIKNAQGWSDYFNGMEPDLNVIGSANPILGDPEERCLKSTLSVISGKTQLIPKKTASISKENIVTQSSMLTAQGNIGMIENRLRLKISR
jgi:hypothetical protein